MIKPRRAINLFACLLLALSFSSLARAERTQAERVGNAIGAYLFSEEERQLLRDHLLASPDAQSRELDWKKPSKSGRAKRQGHGRKAKKGLPPGLAKKDELPPGLSRQLKRNGRLPPGLEKKRLPPGIESRLRIPPAGHERVIVDRHVVLVEKATGVIKDILRDVVRKGG